VITARRFLPLLVFTGCFTFISDSRADSVNYVIIGPSGPSNCAFGETGSYTVTATLNLSAPAKSLQMSAPATCGGSGIMWNYAVSGDPNTVLTVDFGGCISGSVVLYTAQFDVNGCCPALLHGPIPVGPSEDTPPVLIGCDDTPRFLIPPCSANSPSLLSPANGATTSVAPLLSWDYAYGNYCEGGIGLSVFTIEYGTDSSNLDQEAEALDNHQWMLPSLVPETQYYWRVKVQDEFGVYTGTMTNYSEVRSFTTDSAVPVESSTWGAVKALYQ
jgi:hypothetical protein